MRQLPLPETLKEHIANFRQEIALTDAEGRVVAYLFAPDQREAFYDMAAALSDVAAEQARKNPLPPERTAELLAELRALMAKLANAS
jgi:hypothetical protein